MAKKILIMIGCLLLVGGVGMLMFPTVSQWLYDREVGKLIQDFHREREVLQQEVQEGSASNYQMSDGQEELQQPRLPELRAAMEAYNQSLLEDGQSGFRDAWSYQEPSFDLAAWGLEDNVFGYIEIPKMNVTLPLYLGASSENLELGAAHLSYTSLPIGGESSNAVIAGHRGYFRAAMFRDIEKLEVGDPVKITNLWETLTYRVVETKVILPEDIQEVLIQPGRDLVTLVTCHPYGENTHRYVVYCEREE